MNLKFKPFSLYLQNWLISIYEDSFHRPTPAIQLGYFRIFYCLSIAIVHFSGLIAIAKSNANHLSSNNLFYLVAGLYGVALVLSGIGFFTRTMLILSIVGCTSYEYMNAPYFSHTTPIVFFTLLVLAVSPSISHLRLDKYINSISTKSTITSNLIDSWPIRAIQLVLALAFLSGFFAKLFYSGQSWIDGESLRQTLLGRFIINDNPLALFVARKPWLCQLLSLLTLLLESTFWLVIFIPRMSLFYIPLALLFHLAVYLTMDINFFYYFGHSYLIFVNWAIVLNCLKKVKIYFLESNSFFTSNI